MRSGTNFGGKAYRGTRLLAGVSAIALSSFGAALAQDAPATTQAVPVTTQEAPATTQGAPTTTQAPAKTQQAAPVPVPPVSVVAPAETTTAPATGTVADGYRVDTVTDLGPFSNLSVQNTPYSLNVLSSDFLENTGAYMSISNGILDKSPFWADTYTDQRALLGSGSMRGITSSNGYDYFLTDGLVSAANNSNIGAEAYDRIEILSGAVTGFLYGVNGNVGGANYVLKRPTPQPYYSGTLGYDDGGPYSNVDVGNTIANGKFGYRLVAAGNFGDSASIAHQSTGRSLVYSAFDLRPIDNLLVQLDVLHTTCHLDSPPAVWFDQDTKNDPYLSVPNPHQAYSVPWAYIDTQATQVGIRTTYEATDWLALRGGFRYAEDSYDNVNSENYIQANGTYKSEVDYSGASSFADFAGYAFADVKFDTWYLKHKVTFGIEQSELDSYEETPTGFGTTGYDTSGLMI